jgi:hypothetical protein
MHAQPSILVHFEQGVPPINCDSVVELDRVLDHMHTAELERQAVDDNHCPLSVHISIPGYEVALGLGAAMTFLTVCSDPFDDYLYVAVGDEKAEGDDTMFYGYSQDSYWAPRHLIPIATARDAIRYFMETKERTPALKWDC